MSQAKHAQFFIGAIEDPEVRDKLENIYAQLEVQKRLGLEAARAAARATAEVAMFQAQAQIAQVDFLTTAGQAIDLVNTEANWIVRRNNKGAVVMECPITENDIHTMARAHMQAAKDQATDIVGSDPHKQNDDSDDVDLFGTKK